MSTVPTRPAVRGTRHGEGRRRCWPLAITGLALLAISIVMMTVGAQSSRAQTSRQHLAHSRPAPPRPAPLWEAPPRLPAPAGRYQAGQVGPAERPRGNRAAATAS